MTTDDAYSFTTKDAKDTKEKKRPWCSLQTHQRGGYPMKLVSLLDCGASGAGWVLTGVVMDRSLALLLRAWGWVKKLLGFLAPIMAVWTFFKAIGQDLSAHEAMFWGFAVLAVSAAGIYYVLKLVDWLIDGFERFRDGSRMAKLLEEGYAVGIKKVDINFMKNAWLENQPPNEAIRQIKKVTMLRVLKGAVRQKLIVGDDEGDNVNMHTRCNALSAANFFKKRQWLNVKLDDEREGRDEERFLDDSDQPERMPMVEFFKEAEKQGIDFRGASPAILDLCIGLQQAGLDGALGFWGRARQQNDPFLPIPKEQWQESRIDWTGAFDTTGPNGAIKGFATGNYFVRAISTVRPGDKSYYDINVNKEQAARWLKEYVSRGKS